MSAVSPPAIVNRLQALSVQGKPLDLSQNYIRVELAKIIVDNIDAYAQATYHDGFRKHLGASIIGEDCARKVWYGWRWMVENVPTGRLLRLFNRGHREEDRFIEYLVGIGFEVWNKDPVSGKQFKCSRVGGHFGGSLDSILRPPPWFMLPPELLFLGEYKTKGTGGGFAKLKSDGIIVTNGQHYDQMCTYGANYGYQYAIYFAVNKNDDDLHVEVIPLNWKRAEEVEAKATYIIGQQTPPPKIALQETHWKCKGCEFVGVCHRGETPAKNCRSCKYSRPIQDAQWYCDGHKVILTDDVIKTGCPQWTFIT